MHKNDYIYVSNITYYMNLWVPQNLKLPPTCQTYLTPNLKKQLAPKVSNFNRVDKQYMCTFKIQWLPLICI